MRIAQVARQTGLTVRALHYYDQIGLLRPGKVTEAGYREYNEAEMARLRQILLFRELDFPLEEIKRIMNDPDYDQAAALRTHLKMLTQKRGRLTRLIGLVEKMIEGETNMDFKAFDTSDMEKTRERYAAEVKERWGATAAYKESQKKAQEYGPADWKKMDEKGEALLDRFASLRGEAPGSPSVQAAVADWQAYITASYYQCTKEILSCLGEMYLGDQRFTANIDRHGEGTTKLMTEAIRVYCQS